MKKNNQTSSQSKNQTTNREERLKSRTEYESNNFIKTDFNKIAIESWGENLQSLEILNALSELKETLKENGFTIKNQ